MIQQLTINGLIAGSIYALIALGFSLIYRTVKFFHFAHGVIYAAGAYLGYTFLISLGLTPILAILLSVAFSSLLGIIIDKLCYYPLRHQKAPTLVFLIVSFGVFIFLQNLFQLLYGAQILSPRTGLIKEGHHFLGAIITDIQITILIVSLSLFLFLWFLVQKTKLGKAIRAVSDDPIAAKIIGINSERIIFSAFAVGSALAGIAGILISYETNIEPTMGFMAILKGIITSIVGGVGSIPGSILGGFFLGLAENLGIWKIQAGWKDTIAFAVLILFLLLRPQGILGEKSGKEII